MSYDVVGNVEGLYLAFVPIKEVFAYIGILAYGVRFPFHIGVAQEVHIHRIVVQCLLYKFRTFAKLVQKPHLGNNQFCIKEDDIAPISLRYPSVNAVL